MGKGDACVANRVVYVQVAWYGLLLALLPVIKGYLIVDPQPEVRSAVLSNFGFLSGFLIQGDTEKG